MSSVRAARRAELLQRVSDALFQDQRVAGAVLVGSGAAGFRDDESDLDIVAPVDAGHDAALVFREWKGRIGQVVGEHYQADTAATEAEHLLVVHCSGLLELDLSFPPLAELTALAPRWRILWARSDAVARRLEQPAAAPSQAAELAYRWTLHRAVHRVTAAARALRRGNVWKAILQMDELRRFALQLACLELRGDTHVDAHTDALPPQVLGAFSASLPPSPDVDSVRRSLEACVEQLLAHTAALDRRYGVGHSRSLEPLLSEHLRGAGLA